MRKHLAFLIFILLSYSAIGQVAGDYRSILSGTWATAANWQTYSGGAWVAAGSAPNSTNNVITIQSGNYIRVAATLTVDQVVINSGGRLATQVAIVLTIANGTGIDLTVNGTFVDSSSARVSWAASSTWVMGSAGTLIKTTASASDPWQNNYSGGIATIPSSSYWILRRITAVIIPLSTTAGSATGSYYPNLTIENYVAGIWTTSAAGTWPSSATTAFPHILGNLDIGGVGSSTVDLLNDHRYSGGNGTLVVGNVNIRIGNIIRNYGNGLDIQGDLTVNGTINYAAGTGTRNIVFSGGNIQTIYGTGTLNIYNLTVNKSSNNLNLNRAITIDNVLTLTSGKIISTSIFLPTINTNGSVISASNASFVSGPIRYIGISAFTYPVGKGSDYQPLGISASITGGTFWTETFNNGCASNCSANGLNTGNGAWSIDNSSLPVGECNDVYANVWYASCAENGNAAGACGSGCSASNATLHIGSTTLGDLGAAYDAGGFGGCGAGGTSTYTRSVSPLISTAGRQGIKVNFDYIGYGGSTSSSDFSFIEYSVDGGSLWNSLVNPIPITTCCTGACNGSLQGLWTNYISATLPSTAENISNFRLRFVWKNNDDAIGSDPSIAINNLTLTSTTQSVDLTAEYFYGNPQITFNNTLVPSLDHISSCEYWTLTRNSGAANKNVTLNWDANSCGVTLLSDLRVAHWDGTAWQNEGNTLTTGATAAGSVTSGVVTWFSPFTLSSISIQNPLPIELLSFTAYYNGKDVDLKWITATEINNDFFTMERSVDAVNYTNIGIVDGAGNSNSIIDYARIDKTPLDGLSYYRLKQTDFDGKHSYSNIATIEIKNENFEIVNTYNSLEQGHLEVTINCTGNCLINFELYDMTGKRVYAVSENSVGRSTKISIPTNSLSLGIYMLKAFNGSKTITKKIKL